MDRLRTPIPILRTRAFVIAISPLAIGALILLLPALLRLGFWQLERAELRRQTMARYDHALQQPAIEPDVLSPSNNSQFVNLLVEGKLIWSKQFLLDQQVHNTVTGYEVLVPLQYATDRAILVSRGWIPAIPMADVLQPPDNLLIDKPVTIAGVAAIPPTRATPLEAAPASAQQWPKVVASENFAEMSNDLGISLMPRILQPTELQWGFRKVWKPVRRGPLVNYGYAFQWFAMAAGVLGLIGYTSVKRNQRPHKTEQSGV